MPSRSARNRVRRLLDAACVIAICINVGYMVWHSRTYKHVMLDQYEAEQIEQYSKTKYIKKGQASHTIPVVLNRNALRHMFKISEQDDGQVIAEYGGQDVEKIDPNNDKDTGQFDHRNVRDDMKRFGQSANKATIKPMDVLSQIGQHSEFNGLLGQQTDENGSLTLGQMDARLRQSDDAGQLEHILKGENSKVPHQKGLDAVDNEGRRLEQHQNDVKLKGVGEREGEIITFKKYVQDSELCPLIPERLNGALRCECNETSPEFLMNKYPEIMKGGRIRPSDCLPREQVAIIIPYRDRSSHLHKLLKMLIPILTRQKLDATFYVIEQASPVLFNRGALHNIGFLESLKLGSYDCFIFHDVDMMPVNDKLLYRCADNPTHFSVSIKYQGIKSYFKTMYDDNFGGVVGFTRDQYLAINGNSNLYFGWGGEDDDLYERVKNKNLSRVRYAPEVARYEMLIHQRQEKISANPTRVEMLKSSRSRQAIDGLNTVQYKVNYVRLYQLYTWVNVDINMGKLFQNAPIFLQRSIRAMNGLLKKMMNGTQPA